MITQPAQGVRQVPVGEGVIRRFGRAVAASVPRDHPAPRAQRLDLRGKHLVVHEQPVRQDDRRQVPASVLVVDPLAVDLVKWHPRYSLLSKQRWSKKTRAPQPITPD